MKKVTLLSTALLLGIGLGTTGWAFAQNSDNNNVLNSSDTKIQKMIEKAGFDNMGEMHDSMSTKDGIEKMKKFMSQYGNENMKEMHEAMKKDPTLKEKRCH